MASGRETDGKKPSSQTYGWHLKISILEAGWDVSHSDGWTLLKLAGEEAIRKSSGRTEKQRDSGPRHAKRREREDLRERKKQIGEEQAIDRKQKSEAMRANMNENGKLHQRKNYANLI